MSVHYHAVVWIDHKLAKVVFVGLTGAEEVTVHAHHTDERIDDEFLQEVGKTMDAATEILVIGPADEKHVLVKYLESHQPGVARKVVKVEAADDLTDKELAAYGKHHFKLT